MLNKMKQIEGSEMIKRKLPFFFILLFAAVLHSQEKTKCYFDIQIKNQTYSISDYSIKNLAIKSIEQNLPTYMERNYDSDESMHFLIKISLMPVKNKLGDEIGLVFSIYGAIRTYPYMITGLMPEDDTIGITGDKYDLEFLKSSINGLVSGIFGEYDETRELIFKYLNETQKQR